MGKKQVKQELLIMYGPRCMLCGDIIKRKEGRTLHHLIPSSKGGETSVENGAILCELCHRFVHTHPYEHEAYQRFNNLIEQNKTIYKKVHLKSK